MNKLFKIVMPVFGALSVLVLPSVSAAPGDAPHSLAAYFTPATSSPKAPTSSKRASATASGPQEPKRCSTS